MMKFFTGKITLLGGLLMVLILCTFRNAQAQDLCNETGQGAYFTGVYRNMFKELLNKNDTEINSKINAAFQHFFYGTTNQKLYYEVGQDMAYILDVANNDVRSEGMSYGLMICVQLNKQAEFDKLWRWTKTYMQHSSGNLNGFFKWQLNTSGGTIDNNPAPDGEAYFITALFFAANRWGNGTGIFNYEAEAQDALNKVMSKTGAGGINNLFNANSKLITFGPNSGSYDYTDPSYNLPGFWELWARWSTTNKTFWSETPAAARKLLRDASHSTSGLSTDYSNFDGTPKTTTFNTNSHRFMYDAWRTIMNIGMDYHWFKADAQQPVIADRYLTFFKNQGTSYPNHYDWNGANAGGDHSTGLVACNAVASLASSNTALTTPFVQEFWNVGLPSGTYRYYDGMLYMLALLNVSGNFKVWKPACDNPCATPAPTVTATITYELGASATALTATGTSLKWYTVATNGTPQSSAPVPNTSATGTVTYYVSQTLNGCEGPRASITVNVINSYKIFKVSAPITVDGTLDAAWSHASVLPAGATKLLSGTVTNAADLSGNVKALWDDTYLYVLADVSDEAKVNESVEVYFDDGVEFYVDINNDKAATYGTNDVQYTFGWNDGTTVGVLPTGRSTVGITYSAVARTGGYIVEARIPWTTLQGTPAIGQLLGMDFMINDDDNNGERDGKLSWNAAADNAWQDPSLFGTAILQGLLPCTTPAAPTVTSSLTYCQNATATALSASGTGLLWYTSSSGGSGTPTAPVPLTTSTGTIRYYVSQNVNGCESARAMIEVTVNALPFPPTVTSPVTYCQNATATALTANGSSLKWYTQLTNGTALASAPTPSTATAGTTNYYVSQTTNGCEGARATIAVTVNTLPSAPTVTSPVTYCLNAAATALTANGTSLKWYTQLTNGTALASAPTPSTATAGTTNYYVSQTTNGCEGARALIEVTVNALPSAPTVTSPVTYCQNAATTALTANGSSLKWYTQSSNGTALVSAPTPSTAIAGTTNYYVSQTTDGCEGARATIAVTVNAIPSAPTVTSPVAYCQNATAAALSATGTALQWYTASTGGTGSAMAPIPSTVTIGTANYYVSQTTNGCESARAVITVNTNSAATATITAGGSTTFCQGGSVTLTANTGTSYIWMNGTTQVGTNATYSANASGNYTVQITNPSGCTGQVTSSVTVVTVNAIPSAPTVTSPVTYCQNAAATALTANGTSLKWYTQLTNGTALASAPTPSTATAGTTNYYVSQTTNGCEGTRATIAVTVNALPSAPTVTSPVTYCQNAAATALTANGTSLKWYTQQTNGTELASALTPSTATAGTTNYYVSQTTDGCEGARATIAVTVNAIPEAIITPSGPTTFVAGGSVALQANTGSGLSYQWYKENTQVGTGASYTATEAGSYTVKVTNAFQCMTTSQATPVNVNANQPSVITLTSPAPNTTIVGSITITVNVSDPDGGITLVEFLDGTTVIGTSTTAPYSFVWDNPGTGDHSISVRVTDSNGGVTTSSSTTITSGGVTGIWSSVSSINAEVYPNPANGEVYINSDMDLSNASITVVDVLGKEAVQTSVATGNGMKVDVSGLHEGIYILIIKQGNSILQKKITVKR